MRSDRNDLWFLASTTIRTTSTGIEALVVVQRRCGDDVRGTLDSTPLPCRRIAGLTPRRRGRTKWIVLQLGRLGMGCLWWLEVRPTCSARMGVNDGWDQANRGVGAGARGTRVHRARVEF